MAKAKADATASWSLLHHIIVGSGIDWSEDERWRSVVMLDLDNPDESLRSLQQRN